MERPALAVTVVQPEPARWPHVLAPNGSIVAWQEVAIAPEIGGLRLVHLLVDVGDVVHKGQLLAQLDDASLRAELAVSRAGLREAQASADEAVRAAERALALRDRGVLPQQDVEQLLAARDAALARLEGARARVQADRVRLVRARIHAPDDGLVSARLAVEGSLVQEVGELLRLQRQGRLEWRAEVPENALALVRPGVHARVRAGDTTVGGVVRQVSPQVDPHRRTGTVQVDLEAGAPLRAGQFARGELVLGGRHLIALPESAILLRDGDAYVYRVEGDRVRLQSLAIGERREGRVEILDGPDTHTTVVESGVAFLADGARVRIVPQSSATAMRVAHAGERP